MTQQQPTSSDSPFLRAVEAFLRFVVRLFLALAMGALLGAGLFYGAPWAYRNLVQPVQENNARIAALEWQMSQEYSRLQEENRELRKRIVALETEVTRLGREAAAQAQVQQTLEEQIQQLEGRASQVEDVLEIQQDALEEQQKGTERMRERLQNTLVEISQQAESSRERLDDLEGRLTLLQTAQDLLKVRLLLLEENPGSARDVLALAVTHMEQAILLMPAHAETLAGLQERMVELDDLIAARSFRVGLDLEALWANVMELVVPQMSSLGGMVASEGTALPTSTPSP